MRGVVADQFQAARVFAGEEFDLGVALDLVAKIHDHAVERHGDRSLGQRGRDALGDVEAGDVVGELAACAVGKGQGDHDQLLVLTPTNERG